MSARSNRGRSTTVVEAPEVEATEIEVSPEVEVTPEVEAPEATTEEVTEEAAPVTEPVKKVNLKPVVIHWDESVDFKQKSGKTGAWRLRFVETGELLNTGHFVGSEDLLKAVTKDEDGGLYWKSQTQAIIVMAALRNSITGVEVVLPTIANLKPEAPAPVATDEAKEEDAA